MSFDFSTLITDRSQADVEALRALLSTDLTDWTAEQLAAFNQAASRGAYNYTDLNRVTACMEYLNERLTALGYETGYQRIVVPHQESGGSGLPEGYIQLEYIESSGTQYIDTGFKPNGDTRVMIDIQITALKNPEFIFGCRTSTNTVNYSILLSGGAYRSDYGESKVIAPDVSVSNRILINKDKNICQFGDTEITNDKSSFESQYNLFIFCSNDGGNANYFGSLKVYSCKIYDDEDLVREYFPCISPNGEVGFYDVVNQQFSGNSGTGDFIVGPVPVKLPAGYTQVAWIESTGTQCIDTGIQPNQDTKINLFIENESSNTVWLYGAWNTNGSGMFAMWMTGFFYGSLTSTIGNVPVGTLFISQDSNTYSMNNISGSFSHQEFQCQYSLFLFKLNSAGSQSGGSLNGKLYFCRIYSNNSLVRNYVPCINPDGEIGLYDIVSGSFFGNIGTGNFTAGPEVEGSVTPDEPVEKLDPYLWYEQDAPTESAMETYLANVSALRKVLTLPETTAEAPENMNGLTTEEANAIEEILKTIEVYLLSMLKIFLRSDMAWAVSGGPAFYFVN